MPRARRGAPSWRANRGCRRTRPPPGRRSRGPWRCSTRCPSRHARWRAPGRAGRHRAVCRGSTRVRPTRRLDGERADHRQRVHALDHVVPGRLAEFAVGRRDVQDVVDDLEHDAVGVAVLGECVDHDAVVAGDDRADACCRAVERSRLAVDRGEVALLVTGDVVGVAELFDLAFAQPADRAGEQAGDLGAERGGDLRCPRQQEVAGQDRLEVPHFAFTVSTPRRVSASSITSS